MAGFEHRDRIGELLGTNLALFEHDLTDDPDDLVVMEKIRVISEAYRNFAVGGLATFKDDFEHGYERGKRDLRLSQEPEPKSGVDPRLDFGDS